MNKKEITEQEFWEWCGFQELRMMHGNFWIYGTEEPRVHLPPITLDNLFKYAVPKLGKLLGYLFISFDVTDIGMEMVACEISTLKGENLAKRVTWESTGKDPAQALYQAICKVIEGDEHE